jgi:hypothetical protein
VALVLTGLLIGYPELRGRLVGGFGREILEWHVWVAWAFLALPALALALSAGPLLRNLVRRMGPPGPPWRWRKVHLAASLLFSLLLAVSGVLLWVEADLPIALLDASLEVHLVLTWVLVVSVPLHVLVVRQKVAARTRELLGRRRGRSSEEEAG